MRTPLLATLLVTLSEFEGLFGINFLSHFVSFVSMTAAQPALMSDDFTLSLSHHFYHSSHSHYFISSSKLSFSQILSTIVCKHPPDCTIGLYLLDRRYLASRSYVLVLIFFFIFYFFWRRSCGRLSWLNLHLWSVRLSHIIIIVITIIIIISTFRCRIFEILKHTHVYDINKTVRL